MVRFLPLLIGFYVACIFILHAVPTGDIKLNDAELKVVDSSLRLTHVLHFMMFLPWGLLTAYYVYRCPEGCLGRVIAWTGIGLTFAAAAEGIQFWLPFRSFKFLDMFMNLSGVLAGMLVAVAICLRRSKAYVRDECFSASGR